ncbi:hypothetical protein Ciccas_010275, partial [Cichlidogyrus casuarinus]
LSISRCFTEIDSVIFLAVVAINNPRTEFGKRPVRMSCPNCHSRMNTKTKRVPSLCAWLLCLFICCTGGCFGLCLVPFCVDSCNYTRHTCPDCRAVVGDSRATSRR